MPYQDGDYKKASKPWASPGWISPSGDFYPCSYYNHFECSVEISRAINGPMGYDAMRHLEDKGWFHLTDSGYPLMSIGCTPTMKQIEVLYDIAASDVIRPDIENKKSFTDSVVHFADRMLRELDEEAS